MVYLHEIADPRFRAVTGSLGYISLGVGVVFGILMVVMMISLVPAGERPALTAAAMQRIYQLTGMSTCWPLVAHQQLAVIR